MGEGVEAVLLCDGEVVEEFSVLFVLFVGDGSAANVPNCLEFLLLGQHLSTVCHLIGQD